MPRAPRKPKALNPLGSNHPTIVENKVISNQLARDFLKQIRELMDTSEAQPVTQAELCKRTGWAPQTVSKFLGSANPKLGTVILVLKALNHRLTAVRKGRPKP